MLADIHNVHTKALSAELIHQFRHALFSCIKPLGEETYYIVSNVFKEALCLPQFTEICVTDTDIASILPSSENPVQGLSRSSLSLLLRNEITHALADRSLGSALGGSSDATASSRPQSRCG